MKLRIAVLGVALALATLPDGVEAQRGPGPAWTGRPRPLATRPMGVPASVQPRGRPPGSGDGFQPAPVSGRLPPAFGWLPAPYGWGPPPYAWTPAPYAAPVVTPAVTVVVVTHAGAPGSGCARVIVDTPTGPWRTAVVLPALDADTPGTLRAAIRTHLDAGRAVSLTTTNGTAIRLLPGRATGGVQVEPCASSGDPR